MTGLPLGADGKHGPACRHTSSYAKINPNAQASFALNSLATLGLETELVQ